MDQYSRGLPLSSIVPGFPHANIDAFWGPYDSAESAMVYPVPSGQGLAQGVIPVSARVPGLEFGVKVMNGSQLVRIEKYQITGVQTYRKLILTEDDVDLPQDLAQIYECDNEHQGYDALHAAVQAGKVIVWGKNVVNVIRTNETINGVQISVYRLSCITYNGNEAWLHIFKVPSTSPNDCTVSHVQLSREDAFLNYNSGTTYQELQSLGQKPVKVDGYIARIVQGDNQYTISYVDGEGVLHIITHDSSNSKTTTTKDLSESVHIDADETNKVFAIKDNKGTTIGSITLGTNATNGAAELTFVAGSNQFTASLPNLDYDSSRQMLKYIDANGDDHDLIRLSNLQIKEVIAYQGSVSFTPAMGDLILEANSAGDGYILEVFNGTGWQPLGSINDVSLVADQVSFTPNGGLSSTNVQNAIGEVKNKILPPTVIDLSLITEVTGGMENNGKWFPSTDPEFNRKGKYVPVKAGSSYTLLCDDNATYAFMTTNSTPVANGNMPLANGCARENIVANTAVSVVAPSDANYIYIQTIYPTQQKTVTWTINLVPQSLEDMTDDIPSENSKRPISSNSVYELKQKILPESEVDSSEMTTYEGYFLSNKNSSVKWETNAERAVTFIPLLSGYNYTFSADAKTHYGFLTNNAEPNTSVNIPYAANENRYDYHVHQSTISLNVPSDAKYLCVISKIANNDITFIVKKALKDIKQTIEDTIGANVIIGQIDLSLYAETSAAMSNGDTWLDVTGRKSKFIPITGGSAYKITAQSRNTNYAFMKDDSYGAGTIQNFASGESRHSLLLGESVIVQAPLDAKFLYVLTYIDNTDTNVSVECVPSAYLVERNNKSAQGMSAMKNGTVVSEEQYNFAFAPFTFYQGNHIKMVFAGNTSVDGDATINTNDIVLATYSPMTHEWTNDEMPPISQIVDRNGNAISGVTRAYNNCVYVPFGNDIGMFGAMGNGDSNAGFSWGYKTTWEGTTYTRCHLAYGNTEVEFTSDTYRQMLVDKGWMQSKINTSAAAVDCTAIFKVGSTYYVVMCTYLSKGERVELPLVLLSSTDLATWNVVTRLGENVHAATEISFAINDGKIYVIYRALHTINNIDATNGYGIGIYNFSDGSAIFETEIKSYVMSLPICFAVNGNVWCGFNERTSILGTPNSFEYCGDRQQMAFYKFTDTGIDYQFSIENPAGINYPTSVTIPKKNSQGNVVNNLDRIYMAWSEDRRGLYYRQIANVTIADMTDVFK